MTSRQRTLGVWSSGLSCPTQRSRRSASFPDSSHLALRSKGLIYTASEIIPAVSPHREAQGVGAQTMSQEPL